jgi:hypothetical protein
MHVQQQTGATPQAGVLLLHVHADLRRVREPSAPQVEK